MNGQNRGWLEEFHPTLQRLCVNIRDVAQLIEMTPDEMEEWGFTYEEVKNAVAMVEFYDEANDG